MAATYVKPVLKAENAAVIKATLPVVGAHIGEIASLFYKTMLGAHPELARDLFNRGNQAQGQQQRALAGSVALYATLLLDDAPTSSPTLGSMLERIAHKHVSLGVVRSQYTIVFENLFSAIVAVLGEAVTADVAAAWQEVYWAFANDLLRMEDALYADAKVAPGDVWRRVRVVSKELNGRGTYTFELAATDGQPLPSFKAGQYTSVSVELADGAKQKRQYSLVSEPGAATWKISVRRSGEVSTHLHEAAEVGSELEASLPAGEFTVVEDGSDIVLLGIGIGVTPLVGILNYLAGSADARDASLADRRVAVYLGESDPHRASHRAEVRALVADLPRATVDEWYASGAEEARASPGAARVHPGLLGLDSVQDIGEGAHVYLCGPVDFLQKARSDLADRGHVAERTHSELFAPTNVLSL